MKKIFPPGVPSVPLCDGSSSSTSMIFSFCHTPASNAEVDLSIYLVYTYFFRMNFFFPSSVAVFDGSSSS